MENIRKTLKKINGIFVEEIFTKVRNRKNNSGGHHSKSSTLISSS